MNGIEIRLHTRGGEYICQIRWYNIRYRSKCYSADTIYTGSYLASGRVLPIHQCKGKYAQGCQCINVVSIQMEMWRCEIIWVY